MGHPANETEAEVPARPRALLIAVLCTGAGLAFATCSVPPDLLFKCEDDRRCPQNTDFVCVAGYCVPPSLLDGGADAGLDGGVDAGEVDAGCGPVPLGSRWTDGGLFVEPRAEFTLDPTEISGAELFAIGGMAQGDVADGGKVVDSWDVLNLEPGTPSWTPGNLNIRRAHHASLHLPGIEGVFVTGGIDESLHPVSLVVRAQSPAAGRVLTYPSMNEARADHAVAQAGPAKMLVAGGRADTGLLGSVEVWEGLPDGGGFADAGWQYAAPLPEGRAGHTLTPLGDGRLLLAGGETDAGASNALYVLETPDAGEWTPLGAGLFAARTGHVAVTLQGGAIFFAGGEPSGTVEIFDPDAGQVVEAWDAGFDTTYAQAAELPGTNMVLVVGSGSGSAPGAALCNACGCIQGPAPSMMRYGARMAVIPGTHTVVLVGGRELDGGAPVKDTEWMSW